MLSIGNIWTDRMNIGMEPLDDHHKTILRLMLEVKAETESMRHSEDVRGILSALASYSKYHFLAEERIMREQYFPELEQQRAEHRWYVERIDGLSAAYSTGNDAAFRKELLEHLKGWFVNHILTRDLRLKGFISQKKSTLPA